MISKQKIQIKEILERLTDQYKLITSDNKVSTYLNPYQYYKLRNKIHIIKKIDFFFMDGFLLATILKLFGLGRYAILQPDLSGFFQKLFRDSNNDKFYFVGSTSGNLTRAVNNIKFQYPNINIVSYRDGFFNSEDEMIESIDNIINLNPRFIFVGMGAYNQEKFLVLLKSAGFKGSAIACGGFFHQTSQKSYYYPKIIQTLNIRWAYRIFDEPKLIYRYFVIYPLSIMYFIYDLLIYKFNDRLL